MKIRVNKTEFIKYWQMAERCTNTKSTISSIGGVLVKADESGIVLEATDLKTSIHAKAQGVTVLKEGSAIVPAKLTGDLLRRIPTADFTLDVSEEKGTLTAGKNKTRFTTWPAVSFPKLPSPESADPFASLAARDLSKCIIEGSIASSATDSFPKYLNACLFDIREGEFHVVSTDGHRLSLSKAPCGSEGEANLLLPLAPVRELQRLVSSMPDEESVSISHNASLAWFKFGDIEFSIRKVDSTFPDYAKIVNPSSTAHFTIDRDVIYSAVDRIDVIVRDSSRVVVLKLSPGGMLRVSGRAPDFGDAIEYLEANIDGEPLTAGYNVNYIQDGLKAFQGEEIRFNLNQNTGQTIVKNPASDSFLYMVMSVNLTQEELSDDFGTSDGDLAAQEN
jgi:DNA polymerase-3 subunit beta